MGKTGSPPYRDRYPDGRGHDRVQWLARPTMEAFRTLAESLPLVRGETPPTSDPIAALLTQHDTAQEEATTDAGCADAHAALDR